MPGLPVGCESIVHSVASLQEDPNIPLESRCSLLVDFSNAFNSVDRGCMFQEVRSRIPSMAAWVESCYGSQPLLYLGDDKIFSSCGVQQGDPLGLLCFALTLHPVVEQIKREVPGLLINAWYLDDGTLCGSPRDICSALTIIESHGPSRGLLLNKSKSLLFVPADATLPDHVLPPGVPTTNGGFKLLGSPVVPPSFCESSVCRRVSNIQDMLVNLQDLHDSQMETTLLRSCLSLPKIAFALRTCAPDFIRPALAAFDNTMREALSDLAGGPLSAWSWLKASLPCSLGGLNLRRAMLHAPAAYVGSLHQSNALIADILGHPPATSAHLPQCLVALANAAATPEWSSLQDIDVPLRQYVLSRVIDEASFNAHIDSAPDTRLRALALSSAIPHAGDWLNVVPTSALGLHLLDREFRPCLQYWLGLPIFTEGGRCPVCQVLADPFGDHHVGCGGNGDRIHRHNSIRDAIFSAAQTAALAPRRELPSLIPGSQARLADIFLPSWDRGRPTALDVTIISTLQQLTLQGAAITPGHALAVGENRKMTIYACFTLPGCGSILCPTCHRVPWGLERSCCKDSFQHRSSPGSAAGHPPI